MSNLTIVFKSMAGLRLDRVIAQAHDGTMYMGYITNADSHCPSIAFRPMDVDIEPLVEHAK